MGNGDSDNQGYTVLEWFVVLLYNLNSNKVGQANTPGAFYSSK